MVRSRTLPALVLCTLLGVAGTSACSLRYLSKDKDGAESGGKPEPTAQAPVPGATPTPSATPTTKPPPLLREQDLDTAADVVDYARFCKQELGLPDDVVLEPFDCLAGEEIPVTIEGQPLDSSSYRDLAAGRVGCDRPSWLGGAPCANYAFVQKRSLGPKVEAMLLCRMRSFSSPANRAQRLGLLRRNPTSSTFRSYYEFDSLGLIWSNVETGRTCFFDYVGKAYGGRVASPDDARLPTLDDLPDPKPAGELVSTANEAYWRKGAHLTWKAPRDVASGDNCVRCHDSGAFKSSPWIEQVLSVPVNDAKTPFIVVGGVFDVWRTRFPMKALTTGPVATADGGSEPQVCTQCHRIGTLASCDEQIDFAVGYDSPTRPTTFGSRFAHRTWMPPLPEEWKTLPDGTVAAQWRARYARHVAKLKCCCDRPFAKGCYRQDLTKDPLPAPVEGPGPETCP